jgi:hypothetical protein
MTATVLLAQATKKMLPLKTNQQTRSVGCVVIKQKVSTLVACVVNHARPFFEGPCKMIPSSHFSVSMVSLVL